MDLVVALVVALVMALVMALARLAAIRRPQSPPATFINVRLRADYATDMHTRGYSCDMRAFRGAGKTPNPSVIDRIYG
jgi:hypothetical protein